MPPQFVRGEVVPGIGGPEDEASVEDLELAPAKGVGGGEWGGEAEAGGGSRGGGERGCDECVNE